MIDKLIIVESPAKAKTISKFLGSDYVVKSSMGHIRDLPQSALGVDVEKQFNPTYVIPKIKQKFVKELSALVKQAKTVYLATDEDREGEAIGWHIMLATKAEPENIKRIVFHEITKEAIMAALQTPRHLDMSLVEAQQARRILDRLVGYKISPILGKKIYSGLSAGRVQSIALRFIVDREREIQKFVPQEYWVIKAELKSQHNEIKFLATLIGQGIKKFAKLDIKNKAEAERIVTDLNQAQYLVEKITRKETKRSPAPPFITSTLQQEAVRKLGFTAKKTMMIAQQLYEGIDLKVKGFSGLITYMRTDSYNVSVQAQAEAKNYIQERFGHKYLPDSTRIYKTKVKGAQEAHEAIRPTSVRNVPEEIKNFLTPDQHKLYELIWQRFLASQMASAIMDNVSIDIRAKDYLFRVTGQTIKFDGFMVLYIEEEEEETDKQEEAPGKAKLPPLTEKEILVLLRLLNDQKFTEPPPRFNEASLIKNLEKYGIGRPSTYAPIINTILVRKYVKLQNGRFYPEQIGFTVNDILKENFASVIDVGFTAKMEERLDDIAEGKQQWTKVLQDFYVPFSHTLKQASVAIKDVSKEEPTSEICPLDRAPLVIRQGPYGKFMACSNFPKCKFTANIDEKGRRKVPEVTSEKCEKCGLPMIVKFGRRGKFLACSGYPACKNTKPMPKK